MRLRRGRRNEPAPGRQQQSAPTIDLFPAAGSHHAGAYSIGAERHVERFNLVGVAVAGGEIIRPNCQQRRNRVAPVADSPRSGRARAGVGGDGACLTVAEPCGFVCMFVDEGRWWQICCDWRSRAVSRRLIRAGLAAFSGAEQGALPSTTPQTGNDGRSRA